MEEVHLPGTTSAMLHYHIASPEYLATPYRAWRTELAPPTHVRCRRVWVSFLLDALSVVVHRANSALKGVALLTAADYQVRKKFSFTCAPVTPTARYTTEEHV